MEKNDEAKDAVKNEEAKDADKNEEDEEWNDTQFDDEWNDQLEKETKERYNLLKSQVEFSIHVSEIHLVNDCFMKSS